VVYQLQRLVTRADSNVYLGNMLAMYFFR